VTKATCKYCAAEVMAGESTKMCDGCWWLDKRMRTDPVLARKILMVIEGEQRRRNDPLHGHPKPTEG
jgi:hypothetical protein